MAGFEKANPNITVKVTNAGTNKDEYTALNNAMTAGKGAPDIAQIEYYALPEYVIKKRCRESGQSGRVQLQKLLHSRNLELG